MTMNRRKMIALVGGGVILAATGSLGAIATRQPRTAQLPWEMAGQETEVRRRALSYALLAPNPHNRQPWLVDLREAGVVTLFADLGRMLPETDPANRQITIGLGCFLELMRMAALQDGHEVGLTLFPEGASDGGLDARPIARAVFRPVTGLAGDPLFAQVLARRSTKEPYDLARPVPAMAIDTMAKAVTSGSTFGGSVAEADIAELRALTHEAMRIELETTRTYKESVDLFRIGRAEIDANPDGIDFSGPLFEVMGATGLFTRESALDRTSQAYTAGLEAVFATIDTAMGHVWLVTAANTRQDQIRAGADWVRVNLAATGTGLAFQPLSQCLQEYPETAKPYAQIHERLAPMGGTVQMLSRIGYGPAVRPSPRWPLQSRIRDA